MSMRLQPGASGPGISVPKESSTCLRSAVKCSATRTQAPVPLQQLQQGQARSLAWRAWQPQPQHQIAHPPPHPKAIMGKIKGAQSWEELQFLHAHWGVYLNAIHVSAMLTHMAQLSQAPQPGSTASSDRLNSHSLASTSDVHPREHVQRRQQSPAGRPTAQPAHTSVSSHTSQSQFHATLLKTMAHTIDRYQFRQLANSMWAVAKLRIPTSAAWVRRCLSASVQKLQQAQPQELANMLYAVALRPEWLAAGKSSTWLEMLINECQRHRQHLKPQELSNLLWAAGTLHSHGQLPATTAPTLTSLIQHALDMASGLNSQQVGNILWAVAKLTGQPGLPDHALRQHRTPALLPAFSTAALEPFLLRAASIAPTMPPQAAATTLLSVSWLGVQPSQQWLLQLLTAFLPRLPSYNPSELAISMLALAYLGQQPPDSWFTVWSQSTKRVVQQLGSQELAMTAWALHRLRMQPADRFMAVLRLALADKMFTFSATELSIISHTLEPVYYEPDQSWLELYLLAVHDRLQDMTSVQMSNILTSVSQLPHRPPSSWAQAVLAHLQHQLPSMSVQSLAMTVYSLARLGSVPDRTWCDQFLAASQSQLKHGNARDLSSMLWGVALLDMRPDRHWMSEYVSQCSLSLQSHLAALASEQQHQWTQGQAAPVAVVSVAESTLPAQPVSPGMQQGRAQRSAESCRAADHAEVPQSTAVPRQQGTGVVAGEYKWEPVSLARTLWALARLGCGTEHPLVQLCRAAETAHSRRTRQPQAELVTAQSGVVTALQSPVKPDAAATGMIGSLQQDAPVAISTADPEVLVLDGMLQWAAGQWKFEDSPEGDTAVSVS